MRKLALLLVVCALPHLAWGQLMFHASLQGWNEVPARETPAFGSGHATLDLATNWFTFDYTFEGLLGAQTGAHLHLAPAGVNGGIVYHLPMGSPASFAATITAADVEQLLAGNWYVNVHSTVYPGGEIRGQLLPVPEPSTYALGAAAVLGVAIALRRRRRAVSAIPSALPAA